MVRGEVMAVTAVSGIYQWADTHNTARGLGSPVPIAFHLSV